MINSKYKKTFSEIENYISRIQKIDDNDHIYTPYVDGYTTEQQRSRDSIITDLLKLYVESYKHKNESNKWYKNILFGVCLLILLSFSGVLVYVVLCFGYTTENIIESVTQLVTVCITFLTLIVGILKIITKYAFPANDEEYITRIVELIQKNDLENKKENIRVGIINSESQKEENKSNNKYGIEKIEIENELN